ncbi:hypothetical protein ACD661_08385 [Legionella lytica]|uniref:Uncharacterized protein n=1 Tax=Legionella lytica TaxID=96232 RepID=A0ABW8D795_9GAMM
MAYTKQEPQQIKPYTKEEIKSLRKEMVTLKQGIQLPLMVHGVFAPADIKLSGLADDKQHAVFALIEKLKTSLTAHGADTSNLVFEPKNLQELCSLFSDVETLAEETRKNKDNPEAKSSIFSCCY